MFGSRKFAFEYLASQHTVFGIFRTEIAFEASLENLIFRLVMVLENTGYLVRPVPSFIRFEDRSS